MQAVKVFRAGLWLVTIVIFLLIGFVGHRVANANEPTAQCEAGCAAAVGAYVGRECAPLPKSQCKDCAANAELKCIMCLNQVCHFTMDFSAEECSRADLGDKVCK